MAQEALRNAPCLYKVWTYILEYKVQGPFFFCFVFLVSATLYSCGTHTRTGQRSCGWSPGRWWSWFGQRTNMPTASWGRRVSSPSSASTRAGEEKKTNCLALQEGHKHRSIPALPALLFLWKTSFISVREQFPMDYYALPSLYISLSVSQFIGLCTFLPNFLDRHPKEKYWRKNSIALLE